MKTARTIPLRKTLGLLVALTVCLSAGAYPILTLSDGTNTVVDNDGTITITGSAHTISSVAGGGLVSWDGSLGNWSVNVDTGITDPMSGGTNSQPAMDLSFDDKSTKAGTLTITWTDEFGPMPAGPLDTSVGGTVASGATVTYSTYDGAQEITTEKFTKSGGFAGSVDSAVSAGNPAIFKQVIVITNTKAGLDSGDAVLERVSDQASVAALLGLGLAATGLCLWRAGRARRARA